MTTPSPLRPEHQRLQALLGSFEGDEQVSATPWTSAGAAKGYLSAESDLGGLFLNQTYRQVRDGQTTFEARNIFGFDVKDGTYKLYQFDTVGFVPPAPATGTWAGDELVLEKSSPRGKARSRYQFEDQDRFRLRVEFAPAGSDIWQDVVSGVYRRIVPVDHQ
ncbi:DUF1579 family protein [Phyllobacterium sp. 22229]|uniref:DUF1579 family protein n=1 Tax=Phyllobacterium sp. 22229 TaxID=3453895 RepID=UPI003F873AA3